MNLAGVRDTGIRNDCLLMLVWALASCYDTHVNTFEVQADIHFVAAGHSQKAALLREMYRSASHAAMPTVSRWRPS